MACFCCAGGSEGDDDGVVARENDVDPDDLHQADPEIGTVQKLHIYSTVMNGKRQPVRTGWRILFWGVGSLRLAIGQSVRSFA